MDAAGLPAKRVGGGALKGSQAKQILFASVLMAPAIARAGGTDCPTLKVPPGHVSRLVKATEASRPFSAVASKIAVTPA